MNDQAPTSVRAVIGNMIPDAVGVITGIVISGAPLRIKVVNDDKLILSEGVLCVPRHLSSYTVDASVQIAGEGTKNATLNIRNGLSMGDLVYLLSFNNGKKYYILDREA